MYKKTDSHATMIVDKDAKTIRDIKTIKELVESKEFGQESIKRVLTASKKHVFEKYYEKMEQIPSITIAHLPSGKNATFLFTGDPDVPIVFYNLKENPKKKTTTVIMKPQAVLCEVCWRSILPTKVCAQCGITSYCSRSCQKFHWPQHKEWCKIGSELNKTKPTLFHTNICYNQEPLNEKLKKYVVNPLLQPITQGARVVR